VRADEVRRAVIARDGSCIAPLLDKDSGDCYDRWGQIIKYGRPSDYEIDYVRHPKLKRHVDYEAHVLLCPRHHRGMGPSRGRQWATANRPLLRRYLARCHPELWERIATPL
jgi:hypothetical protein